MAFQVSPGVNVREIDLTTIVPAVATSEGAIAGVFNWGPLGKATLVDTETNLVARFGKPTNLNAETWFTAASFLGYSNRLYVSRAGNTAGISPTVEVNLEEANSEVVLSSGNTSELQEGLIVLSSSNTEAIVSGTIAAITGPNTFVLTSGGSVLANGSSVSLQFVSNTLFSAISNTASVANLAYQTIRNEDEYVTKDGTFDTDVQMVARFPGEAGNSLRVSVCANSTGFRSNVALDLPGTATASFTVATNSNTTTVLVEAADTGNATSNATALKTLLNVNDLIEVGNSTIGTQYLKITAVGNTTTSGNNASFTLSFEDRFVLAANVTFNGAAATQNSVTRYWEFFNLVDVVPGVSDYVLNFGNSAAQDELHVVVVDDGGQFTGVPGTVLEVYRGLTRATDGKSVDGAANYWKDVINGSSRYVWVTNDLSGAPSATAVNVATATLDVSNLTFALGRDGKGEADLSFSLLASAYDLYKSAEDIDVSLILTGKSNSFQTANYLVDNIAETRKDCVVFVSPQRSSVVNNPGLEASSVVTFRNNLRSTSYAVLDSGYKYIYDRYNDIYRWVPLNGDTAGICARTDDVADPWFSPAGLNRGQVRNIVRLAYNPSKADRDTLYKVGVNPVVTFSGQGTILFGDKTLLAKPSAFDRINVRRLFITLEKAIATASRFTLFEFNDDFTRSQFRSLVTPFLQDVQSRRGITDFLVVCDETNNTPEVIDRNEFVGDIYIKPARSINFIQLNFIAVRTGVSFSEVIGQF
jgi:hypothetical protein